MLSCLDLNQKPDLTKYFIQVQTSHRNVYVMFRHRDYLKNILNHQSYNDILSITIGYI